MGEVTAISWCDHTMNYWIGCTRVSPACDGCYAAHLMETRHKRVTWGGPGKGVGGISNNCGIENADDYQRVWRVGKKHSGRLLDGVEHNARPIVPALEVA